MQEAIQILHDLIAGIDLELVTYFLLWLFKSNSFGRDSIDLVLLQGAFFSLMVLLCAYLGSSLAQNLSSWQGHL